MLKVKPLILGTSLFAMALGVATAAPVTYLYTGNLFDTFVGPASNGPETRIAAKVTFDQAYVNAAVNKNSILDFEMSTDGLNFSPASNYFLVTGDFTFSAGNITEWDLFTLAANPRLHTTHLQDLSYYQVGPQIVSQNSVSNQPGQWVLQTASVPAPVPEPGTYALMLLGLGCVAAAVRRGRR